MVIRKCLMTREKISPHLSVFSTLTSLLQIKSHFPLLKGKIKNRSQSIHYICKNVSLCPSIFNIFYYPSRSVALAVPPFWMFFFLIWSFSTTQSGCISSELMLGWTLNLHVFWHHAETNTLIQENYILYGIRRKQLIKYLIISQQNIVIELLTNNGKESLVTQATEDTKT